MLQRWLFCALALPGFSARVLASVVAYPAPAGMQASAEYRVTVEQSGRTADVFTYTSPAQWRTNASRDTAWAPFAFSGHVVVRVTKLHGHFGECRVLPTSRGLHPQVDGQTISFAIDAPGQFAVEFDRSIEHPLLVFADPPETHVPDRHDPNVIWFDAGVHDLGEQFITPRSGQTVYLAPGAIVYGRIRANDAANVHVTGRGILSGAHFAMNPPGTYTAPHLVEFSGRSTHVSIDGITLLASPHYNILIRGSDAEISNVKMIGWYYGTDGVGTGPRGKIEDCFFKVNDDAVKLYADDMAVRRCTFWQMENGAAFQLSWNLNHDVHHVRVEDCDVIRVEHRGEANNRGIFCSIHGGSGNLSDYVFDHIRIENAAWRLFLLTIRTSDWARSDHFGNISDVHFRDVSVDGPLSRPSVIKSYEPTGRFQHVTFENLRIGGRLIQDARDGDIDIDDHTVEDVRFTAGPDDGQQPAPAKSRPD